MRGNRMHAASGVRSPLEIVWESDRRVTSLTVSEKGKGKTAPEIVIWGDSTHGLLLGYDVLTGGAPAEAVLPSFIAALERPFPAGGPPRQPNTVRVLRPEMADAIRRVAEPLGIAVEVVAALPMLDDAYRSMEQELAVLAAPEPPDQGYLEQTDIPEPVLADAFAAAADFYRDKPWKRLTNTEPFLLECAAWKKPQRYGIVLGSGGEEFGVSLYQSLRKVNALLDPARGDPAPAIAMVYAKLNEIPDRQAAEVKERGWALATRNAYPLFVATPGTGTGRLADEAEVRELIVAMRLVPPYARLLSRPRWVHKDTKYLTDTFRFPVVGEEVEVFATYPARTRARL